MRGAKYDKGDPVSSCRNILAEWLRPLEARSLVWKVNISEIGIQLVEQFTLIVLL